MHGKVTSEQRNALVLLPFQVESLTVHVGKRAVLLGEIGNTRKSTLPATEFETMLPRTCYFRQQAAAIIMIRRTLCFETILVFTVLVHSAIFQQQAFAEHSFGFSGVYFTPFFAQGAVGTLVAPPLDQAAQPASPLAGLPPGAQKMGANFANGGKQGAGQPPGANAAGTTKNYMVVYALGVLAAGLGVYVVCKPSGRTREIMNRK